MKPVEELMALVRKYGEVHFLGKDDGGAAFHAIRAHAERLCAPSACPEVTDEYCRMAYEASKEPAAPAAPVVAEPAAWQPIETAPHDKTTVALLHANADGYRRYGVGWYMPLTGWQGWGDAAPPPTHWMPLPAHPPAPQGQQKEKQG